MPNKKAVRARPVLQESDLLSRLATRFAPPAWAFIAGVSNATGYRANRHADALAMSLWPSRGLELHGFEVKCDRRDWKRELDAPWKAEPIAKFCDRWWIVVADGNIVKPGELPAGWGLLVANGTGLKCEVEAPKIDSEEWNRGFVAAMCRRLAETKAPTAQLDAARRKGWDEGDKHGQRTIEYQRQRYRALQQEVYAFEKKSGLRINEYNGDRLGEAVRLVLNSAPSRFRKDLEDLHRKAQSIVESMRIELSAAELQGASGSTVVSGVS
jgi:hypothetical protein